MRHAFAMGLILFALPVKTFAGSPREPLGEKAEYVLDKSSARTSSLILKGTSTAEVDQALPNHPSGPSYNVKLSYDFVVRIQGAYQGSSDFIFPASFFTPEFMEKLRQTGTYESPDYKMSYQGQADAKLLDGRVFKKCDRVLFYDVKIPDDSPLRQLISDIAGEDRAVDSIEITTLMHESIPAMGAAKIDMLVVAKGVKIKIGLDLK